MVISEPWPSGVTAVFPDEFLQGRTKDLDPLWNLFFVGFLLADGPSHGGFSFLKNFDKSSIPLMIMAAAAMSSVVALFITYLCARFQVYGT